MERCGKLIPIRAAAHLPPGKRTMRIGNMWRFFNSPRCQNVTRSQNAYILRGLYELRDRQCRNFMTTLFLSQGVPFLLAGDEMSRTQGGNNNAWCHDDARAGLDWSLLEKHPDLVRFVRKVVVG